MAKKIPNIDWTLTIDVGVGPFRFDLSANEVKKLIEEYGLIKVINEDPSELIDWDSYEIPGLESRVEIRNDGLIDWIDCYDKLYFRDRNLIGMTRDELTSFLGKGIIIGDRCDDDDVVSYEELGIDIFYDESWVANSVTVSRLEDYEDVIDD